MFKTIALPNVFSGQKPEPQRINQSPIRGNMLARARAKSSFPARLSYLLLFLAVGLFVWYVLGVNAYASKGYEMKEIQKKISSLQAENKKLNLSLSEKYSIATIQEDFAKHNFVPAGQPRYVEVNQFTQK